MKQRGKVENGSAFICATFDQRPSAFCAASLQVAINQLLFFAKPIRPPLHAARAHTYTNAVPSISEPARSTSSQHAPDLASQPSDVVGGDEVYLWEPFPPKEPPSHTSSKVTLRKRAWICLSTHTYSFSVRGTYTAGHDRATPIPIRVLGTSRSARTSYTQRGSALRSTWTPPTLLSNREFFIGRRSLSRTCPFPQNLARRQKQNNQTTRGISRRVCLVTDGIKPSPPPPPLQPPQLRPFLTTER